MKTCHICEWKHDELNMVSPCKVCGKDVCGQCSWPPGYCDKCHDDIEYLKDTVAAFAMKNPKIVFEWHKSLGGGVGG